MDYKIINLLESMKTKEMLNYSDYLDIYQIEKIKNWYHKFSNNNDIEIEKIINLLYYLYIHEDIDFYPLDRFHEIIDSLCEQYNLEKSNIIDMLHEFREMVFYTNNE